MLAGQGCDLLPHAGLGGLLRAPVCQNFRHPLEAAAAGFVLVAQLSYFTVLLQVEIVPAAVLEAL